METVENAKKTTKQSKGNVGAKQQEIIDLLDDDE
jgi:hypothetical protein